MDISSVATGAYDFFGFLSRAYGSGDIKFDGLCVLGFFFVVVVVLTVLQVAGFGRKSAGTELELLENISEGVHELHLQVGELHTGFLSELAKWRNDLGYIKQELVDLKVSLATSRRPNSFDFQREQPQPGGMFGFVSEPKGKKGLAA